MRAATRAVPLLLALVTIAPTWGGCSEPPDDHQPDLPPRPWILMRPEHRELILARLDREPYASIWANLEAEAAEEFREDPDPAVWDAGAFGENGMTALANALQAWLFDDEAAALKARDFMARIETDFETNDVMDVNIRMARGLMGFTNAWDILQATPWFPAEEADALADKLCEINGKFFERYVDDGAMLALLLGTTQNNHPIRTASAIGYVAMAFPEHPDAATWADWAFSELDYLWGANGHYIQDDGGVSEGPFYYSFAWGVSMEYFIAFDNLYEESPVFRRDCRNRTQSDPWMDHGCVDGEEFQFANPIYDPRWVSAVDWALAIRLPSGARPPLGDANFQSFNGGALLSSFGGDGRYLWDWQSVQDAAYATEWGIDLRAHHLVYFDDAVEATEPPWTTRFFPDGGNAVFRSDWSPDARWGLLVAEHDSARKTVHDHVDGTSFTLAAYGEYLLIDTGYYKPDHTNNAVTANSVSHNLVLIDGIAAPDKGLLTNFRDADAWLLNTYDGERIEYAEAHQEYQQSQVVRSVVFVDGRYFVMGDRVETDATAIREHTFRLHGWAGYESGGSFELRGDGARWERTLAGVDVYVSSTATGLAVTEPPFVEHAAPHVHQFDWDRNVHHHGVMDATVLAREPDFLSLLLPYRAGTGVPEEEQPIAAERLDLGVGVTAWRILHADGEDVALVRESDAPETFALPGGEVLETDGLFVLFRLSGPAPFAVLSRGTHLDLDGTSLATAADAEGVAIVEQ